MYVYAITAEITTAIVSYTQKIYLRPFVILMNL